MRTKKHKPTVQILDEGYQALTEKLGISDAMRFIHALTPGHGDYTAERHKWLGHLTVEDVLKDAREWEKTHQHLLKKKKIINKSRTGRAVPRSKTGL